MKAAAALLLCACGTDVPLGRLAEAAGAGGAGGCQGSYPAGPYGTSTGNRLDPALAWPGLLEGNDNAATIAIAGYFERSACPKARGLIAVDVAFNGPSESIADVLGAKLAGDWSGLGIRLLYLVTAGPSGAPTLADAKAWRMAHGSASAVGLDPAGTFFDAKFPTAPVVVLVDPCAMRITYKTTVPLPKGEDLPGQVQALAATSCMP